MKIELPQQAIEHINSKGEYFHSNLKLFKKKKTDKRHSDDHEKSVDHSPISNLSDEQLDIITESEINLLGEEQLKSFPDPDKNVSFGFEGDKLEEYFNFIGKLSKRKEVRDLLSSKYLDKIVFDWIKGKHFKTEEETLSDFILKSSINDIKSFRIAFPIQNLFIEKSFSVGNCNFTFLRKDLFDDLDKHYATKHGKVPSKMHQWLRDNFQGKVIAYYEIDAEQNKAIEIAKREAEKSLAGLRFYSPSSILPRLFSKIGFFENNIVPATHIFSFSEGLPNYIMEPIIKGQPFWNITKDEIKRIEDNDMFLIDDLLKKTELSDFQEILLNCLFLIDKSITSLDLQDKLVFLLVCLETLLLKNSGEPIQKSIGLRLAFLAFENVEDRKKVLNYLSEAYTYRSSYIHHGRRTDIEDDLLNYFQAYVKAALMESFNRMDDFESKDSFLSHIDNQILTGQKA